MKRGLVKNAHPAEAGVTEVLVAREAAVAAGTETVVDFPPTLSTPPFRTSDGGFYFNLGSRAFYTNFPGFKIPCGSRVAFKRACRFRTSLVAAIGHQDF